MLISHAHAAETKRPKFLSIICALCFLCASSARAAEKPDILFIIADDASRHFGKTYGCEWVKTPHLDQFAREGLAFDNFYVPTSKCAPTRAAILTGRYPWQNGEAANHQNFFPPELRAFSEALHAAGAASGSTGKVWGPGTAKTADGGKRDFALTPAKGAGNTPGAKFTAFLKSRSAGAAFFYWHGSSDPHRVYVAGSGLAAGKKLTDIDRVPAYWPDNEIVRSDMLDYAVEVERFDAHVGELLEALAASGAAANTLVVVTSDHGMPFPRVKGHTYDDAHRVPLIVRWPAGLANPGRRAKQLVSAVDFAPTFLELAGVDAAKSGLTMTGRSFAGLLRDHPVVERPHVLIGRERNDVYARPGSATGLGYPVRGIRADDFLFIRNFAPDRWPCGDPDLGLADTDASPTKALIAKPGPGDQFWEHAFGKRLAEQLFNVATDPDCVVNLAADNAHAATRDRLRAALMAALDRQRDPRVLGKGEVFDHYPTVKPAPAGWTGELPKPKP